MERRRPGQCGGAGGLCSATRVWRCENAVFGALQELVLLFGVRVHVLVRRSASLLSSIKRWPQGLPHSEHHGKGQEERTRITKGQLPQREAC